MTNQEFTGLGRVWLIFALALISALLLTAGACGDDEEVSADPTATPIPAASPTPEVDAAFIPERLFKIQVTEENTVSSAAFAPDGETVAAGTFLEVQLFTVPDGDQIQTFSFSHSVEDLEFAPDGRTLAAALSLGGVIVVNSDDGAEVLNPHGGFDSYLDFSPFGTQLATGNRDGTLWMWDLNSGELLWEAESPDDEWLISIAFDPAGNRVASGYWNGSVHVWDVDTGDHLQVLENPDDFGYARRVAWTTDGSMVAVAGASDDFENAIRIWNVDDGEVSQVIVRESDTHSLAFSPDGSMMAIGDGDGISLWQLPGFTLYYELEWDADPDVSDWITDLEFSPDSTLLIASRWNGYLDLWQVQEPND